MDEIALVGYAAERVACTDMARRLSSAGKSRNIYLISLDKMIGEMNNPHSSTYSGMNRTQKKDRLKRYLRTAEGLAKEIKITMSKSGRVGYTWM